MIFNEHIGTRLAALMDGELAHDDRDRALAHLAGCAKCRSLVEAERALRGHLSAVPMPEPSARLMAALFQIPQEETPSGDDPVEAGDGDPRIITDAVDELAKAAAPLLDVEGRLRQIMGDAYQPPSPDPSALGPTAAAVRRRLARHSRGYSTSESGSD